MHYGQRRNYYRIVTTHRAAAALVLALCFGSPVLELFDSWDPIDEPGDDTELMVVLASACVGVVLTAAAPLLLALEPSLPVTFAPPPSCVATVAMLHHCAFPGSCAGPPLHLRV